jgi:hypothetical protein
LTVTVLVDACDSVTVIVAGVVPLLPSVTLTSLTESVGRAGGGLVAPTGTPLKM